MHTENTTHFILASGSSQRAEGVRASQPVSDSFDRVHQISPENYGFTEGKNDPLPTAWEKIIGVLLALKFITIDQVYQFEIFFTEQEDTVAALLQELQLTEEQVFAVYASDVLPRVATTEAGLETATFLYLLERERQASSNQTPDEIKHKDVEKMRPILVDSETGKHWFEWTVACALLRYENGTYIKSAIEVVIRAQFDNLTEDELAAAYKNDLVWKIGPRIDAAARLPEAKVIKMADSSDPEGGWIDISHAPVVAQDLIVKGVPPVAWLEAMVKGVGAQTEAYPVIRGTHKTPINQLPSFIQ